MPCMANCLECHNPTSCRRPKPPYFLSITEIVVEGCEEDEWVYAGIFCKKCYEGCTKCYGSSDMCLSCKDGLFYSNQTMKCVSKCSFGEYQSKDSCLKCPVGCTSCQNQTACLTCDKKIASSRYYSVVTMKCVQECSSSDFLQD